MDNLKQLAKILNAPVDLSGDFYNQTRELLSQGLRILVPVPETLPLKPIDGLLGLLRKHHEIFKILDKSKISFDEEAKVLLWGDDLWELELRAEKSGVVLAQGSVRVNTQVNVDQQLWFQDPLTNETPATKSAWLTIRLAKAGSFRFLFEQLRGAPAQQNQVLNGSIKEKLWQAYLDLMEHESAENQSLKHRIHHRLLLWQCDIEQERFEFISELFEKAFRTCPQLPFRDPWEGQLLAKYLLAGLTNAQLLQTITEQYHSQELKNAECIAWLQKLKVNCTG